MKKTIIFMTAIIMCVFMLLNLQEIKYEDQWTWEKAPEDATLLLNFSSLEIDESVKVRVLTKLADQYQANIELITARTIDDQYIIYHALYLTHNNTIDHLLVSGRHLEITDMSSNHFVASFNTEKSTQIGVYEDLFGDNLVYYYPLLTYVDQYNLNGQIFVSFLDPSNQEIFINELSQALGCEQNFFVSDMSNYNIPPISTSFSRNITLVFFIGFLLILGFYILKQSKKISILKLNGFGQIDINIRLLSPVFFTQFIFLGLMSLFTWFIFPAIWFNLLKKMCVMVCVSALVCLILIQLIQSHISVSALIKNASHQSFYTGISFAAKIFMAIICSYILGNCLTNLDYSWVLQKEMRIWEPYLDTFVVDGYQTDDTSWNKNLDLFRDLSSISDFYFDIYPLCYLVYPSTFEYDGNEYTYLMATENYLQQYRFYDENKNLITLDPDFDQPLILIPISMKEIEYNDYLKSIDYQDPFILHYDEKKSDTIFSYDPFYAKENHYQIKSPIISVKTRTNMTEHDYYYLANSGIFKFPNAHSKEDILTLYEKHLLAKPILETYSEAFEDQLTLVNRIQHMYLPLLLVTTLIYIFLLYQMTRIYVANEAKKLAIHYTLGYSTLHSFKNYLVMVVMTWIFSLMAYYLSSLSQFSEWNLFRFIEYDFSFVVLFGIWMFCLLEMFTLVSIILWTKRQSFVTYLKGNN